MFARWLTEHSKHMQCETSNLACCQINALGKQEPSRGLRLCHIPDCGSSVTGICHYLSSWIQCSQLNRSQAHTYPRLLIAQFCSTQVCSVTKQWQTKHTCLVIDSRNSRMTHVSHSVHQHTDAFELSHTFCLLAFPAVPCCQGMLRHQACLSTLLTTPMIFSLLSFVSLLQWLGL